MEGEEYSKKQDEHDREENSRYAINNMMLLQDNHNTAYHICTFFLLRCVQFLRVNIRLLSLLSRSRINSCLLSICGVMIYFLLNMIIQEKENLTQQQ